MRFLREYFYLTVDLFTAFYEFQDFLICSVEIHLAIPFDPAAGTTTWCYCLLQVPGASSCWAGFEIFLFASSVVALKLHFEAYSELKAEG